MSKLIKIILIAAFLFVVVFLIVNQFILNKNLSNLRSKSYKLIYSKKIKKKLLVKKMQEMKKNIYHKIVWV